MWPDLKGARGAGANKMRRSTRRNSRIAQARAAKSEGLALCMPSTAAFAFTEVRSAEVIWLESCVEGDVLAHLGPRAIVSNETEKIAVGGEARARVEDVARGVKGCVRDVPRAEILDHCAGRAGGRVEHHHLVLRMEMVGHGEELDSERRLHKVNTLTGAVLKLSVMSVTPQEKLSFFTQVVL